MGADKNSPRRELGLCPKITSKCPPHVLSRSRSNHHATDPRNNTTTRALETSSRKQPEPSNYLGWSDRPTGAVRPLGVRSTVHNTPGHPSTTRRVTRPETEAFRVTRPTHTGSPVQTLRCKPGPGRFDRLPGAVRPPPPVKLQSTRIDPLQRQINTKINNLSLGRLDRPTLEQ